MKSTMKIIINGLLVITIIVAAVVTILALNTREQGVSNIGEYIPFSIQTNSMANTMKAGDLIITKTYNDQKLKQGDIITFFYLEQNKKIIITHRIIEVKENSIMTSYITKGDNNIVEDDTEISPGDIIAVYTGTRIPFVGYILDLFKSRYGFLIFIILPLFIFFLYQLYSFVGLLVETKKGKITAK